MSSAEELAAMPSLTPWDIVRGRLDKVRGTDTKGMARCPAHEDRTPSLSWRVLPSGDVLLKCFAGCDITDICSAVGLKVSELYASNSGSYRLPPPGTFSTRHQLKHALDAREVSFSPVSPGGLVGNGNLPFAPLSLALANVPEEPVWTWRGYLAPGSLTLLAGKPKVGKSTFVFGLVAALVQGAPFLELETRESGVLLLSEEREGTLAEKRQDWSLDGRVHVLMRYQANGQEWPRVVEEAAAYCREERLGVLVVDTWDKWTGLKGDAENNAGAVLEALEPLLAAAGTGLCVLVVSHQRKADGDFGEAVRGSNALIGGVDIVTELERPKAQTLEGHDVRLLRAVSRYAATPEDLVLALTDEGYEARGDTLTAQAETERQQLVR